MTPTVIVVCVSLCFLLTQHCLAFEILAIVSLPYRSHYMAFRTFFHELAVKGHNVTVINNFPDKDPPPNLRFVNIQAKRRSMIPKLSDFERTNSQYEHLINLYRHIAYGDARQDCEYLFTSVNVKALYDERRQYDVIFVEQFISDCALAYAISLYDAPIIGITSHVLLPYAYPRLGIPFDVSADQFYFSNAGPNPPLLQKLETFLANAFFTSLGRWIIQRPIYEVFNEKLPKNTLDIERDAKVRLKMMFSYQHYSVTGARLLPPQLLEIGGIHVGIPKPLPRDVEEFLSDAKHGAIYVSFGSNLKANTMSDKKLQQFLTTFKRIPQKVIWKYENATFSDKKILTGSWFPQLDILCHPKILAFISHGGMLSLSESTHCGKPLITIPFFGDQYSNSAAVKAIGLGTTIFFDKLDAINLEDAINKLTSPEYQENAKRISLLWHDRPVPVMESAIYWTEYVARHQSAPPSLPSKQNTWFEASLLDVAIVITLLVTLLGMALYRILKISRLILVKIIRLFYRLKVKRE